MSELKFSMNQRFSGIADLWVVKALVWTTNHIGSPIPKIDTVPYRRGYPLLSFSLRKCAFWSYLYPFFNRKPEYFASECVSLSYFPFYTGIIGCHRNYADLHMLIVNLEQYSFMYVTLLSNLYRVLMYVFHSLSVPFY